MPLPEPVEVDFAKAKDKASVYFFLRALMRTQVKYGTRISPFNVDNKENNTRKEISDAVREVVEDCAQEIT